ncbi:hypothetical protein DSO57_1018595 [Entomophthora muscae]|uniref:Uncharacterized protein n=1 Tax=Entomophthora muscae TaxID=34485 RepID=A0ACC2RJ15_9FUNG|nr:hypothetical protein DSO57_1018595 [Entomophthora muscae]
MDEANNPQKITDIEASIAALNQKVQQQILHDKKLQAVPALPMSKPAVLNNEKASKICFAKVPNSGKNSPKLLLLWFLIVGKYFYFQAKVHSKLHV